MLVHHIDEPLVCLMACGEAVGGREPERHLGWQQVRVGILAANGQAGCVSYAVKLRAMIGRCDGWMGRLHHRIGGIAKPLQSIRVWIWATGQRSFACPSVRIV